MKSKEKITLVPIVMLIIVSTIILIGIFTNKETGAIETPPANITDSEWDCSKYGHSITGTQTCTTSQTCSKCGLVIAAALGHNASITYPATSPTCTEDGHTAGVTCTRCGATLSSSSSIPALGHEFNKDGKANIVDYTKTATQHTPIEKCIRCSQTKELTAEAHTGATHANGGKCTVCGQVYQTHSKGTVSYTKTATQHTPTYKCSYSGCTETYTGTAEAHKGATHVNGGKCTVCGQVYQTHSKGTLDSYTKTATQHTPTYKCSYSGCTETYTGTAEAHTGATHANGGKCTVCGQVYQTHNKGTLDSYTKTTTGHTPIYKCSYSGCTETYTGTVENHTVASWKDNKDGTHSGDCTTCQYTVTASHTVVNGECTICKAKIENNSTEPDTKGWTDTSKTSIKLTDSTIGNNQSFKLSVEGITTNKDSQYYLYLTNGNNKPTLSVDSSNFIKDGYYTSEDATSFQSYSKSLTGKGEAILEQNGDVYAWIVESKLNNDNKRENKFILESYKVERPALLSLGKRVTVYFSNDETSTFNWNINAVNNESRKLKVKIGIMNDNSILKAIKNNESGALEKLLTYSKSAQATYNGTLKMGKTEPIVNEIGITNGQYYYAYFELDDENGKYYPIEDVMLYQGKVDSTGKWLYNYVDKNFKWNITDDSTNNDNNNNGNNNNGNNNSTSTPEDSTVKPGKLPQTGATPIFITAVIATIGVAGFAVYKMKKLKDVK